ncbi:MAG: hypothetical protein KAU20_06035 [Nanoarchaeota archaeon]|nr:hypothetical protein [Nanoarchaeota archaeon]
MDNENIKEKDMGGANGGGEEVSVLLDAGRQISLTITGEEAERLLVLLDEEMQGGGNVVEMAILLAIYENIHDKLKVE